MSSVEAVRVRGQAIGAWLPVIAGACLLGLSSDASAAGVDLQPGTDAIDLSPAAEVLHDSAGRFDAAQASAQPGWQPLDGRSPVFGFAEGAHWFRTRVHHAGHEEQRWVYLIPYSLLDRVDLEVIRADGSIEHRSSGDRLPFATRDLKHRHFNFLTDIARGETVDLLLRVQPRVRSRSRNS